MRRHGVRQMVLLGCLWWGGVCLASAGDIDTENLSSGDVKIEWRQNEAGIDGIRATFAVKGLRTTLWRLLLDYSRFSQLFPRVREAKVIHESREGAEVEFHVDAIAWNLHYVLNRSYLEPERRITWTRKSGDLRKIEGGWTIDDAVEPGFLRVTYESYVDAGWFVPSVAVKAGARRETLRMVERLRTQMAKMAP